MLQCGLRLSRRNTSQTRLILGSRCHGGMRSTYSWHGDVDTGTASVWSNEIYIRNASRFFDERLKGLPPAEDGPRARIYVEPGTERRPNAAI